MQEIRGFRRRLQERTAERVVPTPHGTALLSPSIRHVYDENYLSVERVAPGAVLAAEADEAMAGHFHRRLLVEDGVPGLAGELAALGYGLSTHLVLAHRRQPDRRVDTSTVRDVELEVLLPPRMLATLRAPWGDEEIAEQLNEAKRRIRAAVPTRYFGAFADGELAGWCELRVEGGVAQIEDVEVLEEFRGRGLGRAVVQHALDEGLRAAPVVFLEALADDWPRELYAKLGFDLVGRRDFFTKLPPALYRLRLRTPRLELRLATVAEARALFRVAAQGVHDPSVMPFEVPWTDRLDEEDFVGHVTRADPRAIRFVAFLDGAPIGVQALDVHPEWVSTGSWLGRAYQGLGLGTEMRTAVLTYAFDHLGASLARSGAIAGNPQSLGVSRKLGYDVVGSHTVSPRGEPVEHVDLELTPARFRPAVPVAMDGAPPLA